MLRPLQTGSWPAYNRQSDNKSVHQPSREMQVALCPRVPAHAIDSTGSATTQQWLPRESERMQRWQTAACGAIIVCHSERSEESQFVIKSDKRKIRRLFRFAQHDKKWISLRKASDSSDTNHFETAHSDRTFSSNSEIL